MKKVISSGLLLLFLAVTFITDTPPPGWYQQTLPVNKLVTDIHFIDSLKGWAVTNWDPQYDSSYVLYTTNAGNNWNIQWSYHASFTAIQMVDINTGYITGGTGIGRLFKTTNGGTNWNLIFSAGHLFEDLFFVNPDTGWISDEDISGAGLLKTTNGGINLTQQLSGSFRPTKLFFLNKDTGWVACQNVNLYRTTNGGSVWTQIYSFPFNNIIRGIFFVSCDTGWTTHYSSSDTNGIYITTNSGFNWITQHDPDPYSSGLGEPYFTSNTTGYIATGFSAIIKTTNSGINWFKQNGPSGAYGIVKFADSVRGWAGGTILIHTTDGGGPPQGIIKSNTTVSAFKLKQNYPNPFNGITLIFFDLPRESRVDLRIYNILGEEVSELLDDEFFTAGTVQFGFDSNKEELSSGVYFYRLTARTADKKEIFIDTKKMVLIK